MEQKPYKTPLTELGLENRLAMAVRQRDGGGAVTPFIPGSEGRVFLVHEPSLIRDVLGRQSDRFVEDKHPYAWIGPVYSPQGREVLLLDKSGEGGAAALAQRRQSIKRACERHFPSLLAAQEIEGDRDLFPFFSLLVLDVMASVLFDFEMGELSERFFLSSMRHEDFLAVSRRGRPGTPEFEAQRTAVRAALLEQELVANEILKAREHSGATLPSPLPMGMPPARALVRTLLNAYAGTATTLSWMAILLAAHKDWQNRARNEKSNDASPAGSRRDSSLELVARETLRLYPTAWMMSRTAIEPTLLGETPIPKGGVVFVCTYSLHRDPRLWKEAEKFLPERFLQGEFGGAVPYSYLPFGAGPHRCSGMRFALETIGEILGLLLQEFELRPSAVEPIYPFPRVALQPEPGGWVGLSRRAR